MPNGKRDWDQPGGLEAGCARDASDEVSVDVDARAAAFEGDRIPFGSLHNSSNCLSYVVDMGWLQFRRPAAEHRIGGQLLEQLENDSEKGIVRPKHDCRADQDCPGVCRPNGEFALAAAANVRRSRLSVGTNPRDVDKLLNSEPARLHSHALGALDMHCVKRLFAVFDIETDCVYRTARASDGIGH